MDERYMKRAISLAEQGIGRVSPNPLVGAVLVKDGRIIGEGCHRQYGGPHAEVEAVRSASEDVRGATAYVTLEPCSHHGKTPPCADLLVKSGIRRAVIGSLDPNPLVSGRGVQKLRDAGIEVQCGVLEEACLALNPIFLHYITQKTPYVVMKTAMSLDGKIATPSGESKWITGEAARADVQALRHALTGILVGVNTVIQDDPRLTCRLENGVNPVRILVDSTLRIPLTARVLQNQDENRSIVATTERAPEERRKAVEALGARVLVCKTRKDRVDLADLMQRLGRERIDSILLEGGSALNYAAMEQGIVHRVISYIAPKIIGGRTSKTPVGGEGIARLQDAFSLQIRTVEPIGTDWKITADVVSRKEEDACLPES